MDTQTQNRGVQQFELQNFDVLASEQILIAFGGKALFQSHIAEPVPYFLEFP